ncbi:MazG-like family protein [Streptococcaceae bacterium ESL0687]|nr:MazG-like family protein [Streptococcaceae bacterium ESL0687]
MDFEKYTDQTIDFYRDKGWYEYDPTVRINFLRQEVDELVASIEKTEKLLGEPLQDDKKIAQAKDLLSSDLGSILDNLIILADKYDLTLEEVINEQYSKREK